MKPFNTGFTRSVEHIHLNPKVVAEEVNRVRAVGQNAADLRGSQYHIARLGSSDQFEDGVPLPQFEFI